MEREAREEQEKREQKLAEFRKACTEELEANKRFQEIQRQKEQELDNKPPAGDDLMH